MVCRNGEDQNIPITEKQILTKCYLRELFLERLNCNSLKSIAEVCSWRLLSHNPNLMSIIRCTRSLANY